MRLGDTIVAVAAHGASNCGRAMIRLSGTDAFESVATVLVERPARTRGISTCRFGFNGTTFPGILATFPAPASYTGEDVIELQLPANRTLIERFMANLTSRDGVRLAGPGEFTARAFLHGRLDAQQAEGVGAMIAARSAHELVAARDLLEGLTGERFRTILSEVVELLALVEAGIDFTDQEDVVAISPQHLAKRLARVLAEIDQLLGGASGREANTDRLRAVLVGPPNAGKSTLFNALLGRERAVTSDLVGTTRDALVEPLPPGDRVSGWYEVSIDLVDLAGMDAAFVSRNMLDASAQSLAREHIARAAIIVLCDPTGHFEQHIATRSDAITLRVRTKADLIAENARRESLAVCALDGWHVDALRQAIRDAGMSITNAESSGDSLVLARHARALAAARTILTEANASAIRDSNRRHLHDSAVMALTLRTAIDALGEIAGRISADDVLGRIFATFCVGK